MSYAHDDPLLSSKELCPSSEEWSPWWDMGWFNAYLQNKTRRQKGMPFKLFYQYFVRPDAARRSSDAIQLSFAQGARFGVSAEAIRSNTREYYLKLLDTVSHDKDPWAGYFFWNGPGLVFSDGHY